jgi:hypothetical protein
VLKAGSTLVRQWRGRTHTVVVREDGFEYEGQRYRSLTLIAERITGAHWSLWRDQASARFAPCCRRSSQAGPGNDINAGSPGSQNAPMWSLPAWFPFGQAGAALSTILLDNCMTPQLVARAR